MAKIYYLPSHEYIRVEGNEGYVGISEYAAAQLGVVTYVDAPEEGDGFEKGEEFGAIESRKAASDLYMPVTCEVLEVNPDDLTGGTINNNPLEAWIVKVAIKDLAELAELLTPEQYAEHIAKEAH